MNTQETAAILAIIKGGWQHQWKRQEVDEPLMLKTYQLGLRDVAYTDAEMAVAGCIEDCKFIPTVAEIRERLPQRVLPRVEQDAAQRAPRSAYDMGYLPRPTGPVPYELPGVPTLADILAREAKTPPEPLPLPALQLMPDRKAVGG
jgi:hypothetical protein